MWQLLAVKGQFCFMIATQCFLLWQVRRERKLSNKEYCFDTNYPISQKQILNKSLNLVFSLPICNIFWFSPQPVDSPKLIKKEGRKRVRERESEDESFSVWKWAPFCSIEAGLRWVRVKLFGPWVLEFFNKKGSLLSICHPKISHLFAVCTFLHAGISYEHLS